VDPGLVLCVPEDVLELKSEVNALGTRREDGTALEHESPKEVFEPEDSFTEDLKELVQVLLV